MSEDSHDSVGSSSPKDPGLSYLHGLTFGKAAFLMPNADPVATTIGVMQRESYVSSSAGTALPSSNGGDGILGLIIAIPFIFIFGSPFFEAYFITKLLPGILHVFDANDIAIGVNLNANSNEYEFVSGQYYYYYFAALIFTVGLSLIKYVRGFYIFFITIIILAATQKWDNNNLLICLILGMLVYRLTALYFLSKNKSLKNRYKILNTVTPITSEIVIGFGIFIIFIISSVTVLHFHDEDKRAAYLGQSGMSEAQKLKKAEDLKKLAIWKKAMEDREPITSVRMLFPSTATPMLINDEDATRAFNTIIQKKSGLFTVAELENINRGLHIDEMNSRFEKLRIINRTYPFERRWATYNSFMVVFNYAFLFCPDWEATQQLWNSFKPHIDNKKFQKEIPYEAEAVSSHLNSSSTINIHCSAFDKGLTSYIHRAIVGLWRAIDYLRGKSELP